MLGAVDGVQMLLLCSHCSRLQRLCVALQCVQLFPLTVHVVLVTLQIRSLKVQVDSELGASGSMVTSTPTPDNSSYLGEGFGTRSTDKRFLSSVSPLVILQMRLVFKCLQTGETHAQSDRQTGEAQSAETFAPTLSHIWQANGLSLL